MLTPEQLAERRKGIGGSDAAKIVSGDWYKPVYIVSIPASRSRDIRIEIPLTWVSGPAFASRILTFLSFLISSAPFVKRLWPSPAGSGSYGLRPALA